MAKNRQANIQRLLPILLRPLMRFCLRYSIKIQELLEAAKITLLDVAQEELEQAGEEVNVSRLSVVTGIHRRDVMRIYRDGSVRVHSSNLIMRILGQWQADKRYSGGNGPRVLTFEGEASELAELVRTVTQDVHHMTVLFELERLALVERTTRGIRLLGSAHVPAGDPEEGFSLIAEDMDALLISGERNIFSKETVPNLHGRTEYDNIREEAIPKIRDWLYDEGSRFHERARKFLAAFDLDIRPDSKYQGKRCRAVLGTFGFVESSKQKQENAVASQKRQLGRSK